MKKEKRLIDANALLESIDRSDRENFHKGVANRSIHHYEHRHFMSMVLNAPTVDAVEVVRCEDCKYFGTDMCAFDTYAFDVTEESFCSYGERIENG